MYLRIFKLALFAIMGMVAITGAAENLSSYAFVQEDGSLRIEGRTVRLSGIYIPPTERQCRTFERPVRCAPRALLALDFKINGFVFCKDIGRYDDGSIEGVCYVDRTPFSDGEDLAAYLLENGWALALPGAPFAYQALEKIARYQNRGVWGFQVDSIRRRER